MTQIVFGSHDRQGPKQPLRGTPPRSAGSVRRTTTLDGLHPQGAEGPVKLRLRARDLRTGPDGAGVELASADVCLLIDRERGVLEVGSHPAESSLTELIGASPWVGWRRRIDALLPGHRDRGSLLYMLMDSVSAWMGLSSFGLLTMPRPDGSSWRPTPPAGRTFHLSSRANLCAGWQEGGTLLQLMEAGHSGADFVRPPAPTLEVAGDPMSWHPIDPLPPYGARRRRRIDVVAGDPLHVDGMFRDSSADGDGTEGVMHEYTVTAAVDPRTLTVVDSAAMPRALPYQECPQAAVSAGQVVGRDVREMRQFVGREMRGPTTCTHLNELYRTFADIGALAALL